MKNRAIFKRDKKKKNKSIKIKTKTPKKPSFFASRIEKDQNFPDAI